MPEQTKQGSGDIKHPQTSVEETAKQADEDSIVLKLNSENNSDGETDSPQPQNKTADTPSEPKKTDAAGKKRASQPADRKKNNFLWVSNINRGVKAADLKALFSKVGKVCTAKILTNGKSFYGYVSMESHAVTMKCVKEFDATLLDGVNITVSKSRPDLTAHRKAKQTAEDKSAGAEEVVAAPAQPVEDVGDKAAEKVPEAVKRSDEEQKTVAILRQKVDDLTSENARLRRKMETYQKSQEQMRVKCSGLERDLRKSRDENREERKILAEEKESFERDRKQTITRIKADREEVMRNLAEVRKLKERLKAAVGSSTSPYKRERSPPKFAAKRSRNGDYAPPKMEPEAARKRYSDSQHFEYRHKPLEGGRPSGHWQGQYQKDVRSKPLATGYPLEGSSRYGGVSQGAVASRSSHEQYYQPW